MRHWSDPSGIHTLLRYSLNWNGSVYKHNRTVPINQDILISEYRHSKKAIVVEHVNDGEVWTIWFGRRGGHVGWEDVSRQYADSDTAATAMVMWTFEELVAITRSSSDQ